MQKALKQFDFGKPLMWDLADRMEEFHALVENPPLHSVVARIEPTMAKAITKATTNSHNRPLNRGSTGVLWAEIDDGQFELTGDTLKISKSGKLIDGQHRLAACVQANKGIDTHVVFGLPDSVFDVLDRQRTRTAADILTISGVKDATIVAGATRWGKIITERKKSPNLGGSLARSGKAIRHARASPRVTRELVAGPMKDLRLYTRVAEEIRAAYKMPPTMICGLLWAIGRENRSAADNFSAEWLNGNRNYARNRNFDVLLSRIASVRKQNNGHLNRTELAAMLVQCFNHWNAGVAATPRSLTWKREWVFPALAFDKEAFISERDRQHLSNTSLVASQERMLEALKAAADNMRKVKMSYPELAKRANVHRKQVGYVLRTMVESRQIYIDKKGGGGGFAADTTNVYRIPEEVAA